MKNVIWTLLFLGATNWTTAQAFKEWFLQKQTQKEYLIKQIAALQVYAGYVEKGYDIARTGLTTLGDIKKGDLNLHSGYFNSLKSISPAVAKYARVADIISIQLEIVSLHKSTIKKLRQISQLTPDEEKYMESVYTNLLSKSSDLLDELVQVTTAGKLEMKDNERLQRIDKGYSQMQDLQEFAQSFFSQAQTLSLQRQKEKQNVETSRLLYGIK